MGNTVSWYTRPIVATRSATWSPLASGLLSGKYNDGIPSDSRAQLPGYEWLRAELTDPKKLAIVRALQPIASDLGGTMSQLALAWCVKNPNVSTVITGASRATQVRENMKALDLVPRLTDEIMGRINAVLAGD